MGATVFPVQSCGAGLGLAVSALCMSILPLAAKHRHGALPSNVGDALLISAQGLAEVCADRAACCRAVQSGHTVAS